MFTCEWCSRTIETAKKVFEVNREEREALGLHPNRKYVYVHSTCTGFWLLKYGIAMEKCHEV